MKIQILNNIAKEGLEQLKKNEFSLSEDYLKASGIVLRSHNLTELEISESLLAIARAGAGTNNIDIKNCSDHGLSLIHI
mgnify:FL=1